MQRRQGFQGSQGYLEVVGASTYQGMAAGAQQASLDKLEYVTVC